MCSSRQWRPRASSRPPPRRRGSPETRRSPSWIRCERLNGGNGQIPVANIKFSMGNCRRHDGLGLLHRPGIAPHPEPHRRQAKQQRQQGERGEDALSQSLHVSSQGPRVSPGRRSHGDRSCVLCLRYCFCGKKPQSRPLIPVYYSSLNPKIGASGTPVELAIAFLTEMRGLPVKRADSCCSDVNLRWADHQRYC